MEKLLTIIWRIIYMIIGLVVCISSAIGFAIFDLDFDGWSPVISFFLLIIIMLIGEGILAILKFLFKSKY
jgi:hypothetical protein